MKATVVFESIYGNTQEVAEAIARGLSDAYETSVVEVGHAQDALIRDIDLLVVGGPTHAFGMSRPSTRRDAVENRKPKHRQHGWLPVSEGEGVREWLAELPRADGVPAAAFDTRVPKKGFISFGSAARGIASELKKRGFSLVAEPEGFFVRDSDGPLVDGEPERAEAWGRALAQASVQV